MEDLLAPAGQPAGSEAGPPDETGSPEDAPLTAVLEALIYVAEEPLTLPQIAGVLQQPTERIRALLDQLVVEFERPEHGITIREVAGGYKMATKPEHHEAVRSFVKSLKPPLKLSLPALETLAVIAYKQPVTAPEIMEIRGVQGASVLKTLLDRKLIAAAGRKAVIGKPILYKTTRDFLIQFGLKDLTELPSLKEFEEIRRLALSDSEMTAEEPPAESVKPPEAEPFAGRPEPPAEAAGDEEIRRLALSGSEMTAEEPPAESVKTPEAEPFAGQPEPPSEAAGDEETTPSPTSSNQES